MASITVNDLDDILERRLLQRASEKGVSVEREVRDILIATLCDEPHNAEDLASSIRAKFAPFGGVELELPPRAPIRDAQVRLSAGINDNPGH